MDFVEAHQQRREIFAYIKRQQSEEATCIGQIKSVAVDGKRELLRALASWLTTIGIDARISDRTRQAFAKVTTQVSVDLWVQLNREQVTVRARLEQARTQAERSEKAYYEVASFGFLSNAFADDKKKTAIKGLKFANDYALAEKNAAELEFGKNEQALSEVCESFLRDSQIPYRLKAICEEPELAVLVVPILERAKQRATEIWETHARKHAKHSSDLETAARGLRLFYEASSSSLPNYLPEENSEK